MEDQKLVVVTRLKNNLNKVPLDDDEKAANALVASDLIRDLLRRRDAVSRLKVGGFARGGGSVASARVRAVPLWGLPGGYRGEAMWCVCGACVRCVRVRVRVRVVGG